MKLSKRMLLALNNKESIPALKKDLDRVFSIWIRNRGAVNGHNKCFTCGKIQHVSKLQDGHYVSRSNISLRWDEINNNPQCVECNILKHGNMDVYAQKLQEKYGEGILQDLQMRKRNIFRPNASELKLLIQKYKK